MPGSVDTGARERCGNESKPTSQGVFRCELPFGHAGEHRCTAEGLRATWPLAAGVGVPPVAEQQDWGNLIAAAVWWRDYATNRRLPVSPYPPLTYGVPYPPQGIAARDSVPGDDPRRAPHAGTRRAGALNGPGGSLNPGTEPATVTRPASGASAAEGRSPKNFSLTPAGEKVVELEAENQRLREQLDAAEACIAALESALRAREGQA